MNGFKILCAVCGVSMAASLWAEGNTPAQLSHRYGGFYHRFFPDTITHLQKGFIQTKLLIRVDTQEDLALIQAVSPLVLDDVIDHLNAQDKAAMKTRKGRKDFRQKTVAALNELLQTEMDYPIIIKDILITRINIE